jgi:hypothetical protein
VAEITFDSPAVAAEPRPVEAEEVVPEIQPEEATVPEEEPAADLAPEKQLQDEIARKEAFEKAKKEWGRYDYESTSYEGDQMAKVRAEMAAEAAGTISDLEWVKIQDNIDLKAPDEETAEKMKAVVDRMSIKTDDGKMIGNYKDIMREVNTIAWQSDQPDLSYLQRYSIRDEIQENARLFGTARDYAQDGATLVKDLSEGTELLDGLKIKDIAPQIGAAGDASSMAGYYEGYRATGDGKAIAAVKAFTQVYVKNLVLGNPVTSVADTVVKHTSMVITGSNYSGSKALEFQVNTFADVLTGNRAPVHFNHMTGQFETGGAVLNVDSPEVTRAASKSLLSAITDHLNNPNLSAGDRQDLLAKQQELIKAMTE